MNKKRLTISILVSSFFTVLLIFEGYILYHTIGPGMHILGHITLAMFIICVVGLFLIIADNIKEITQEH